jgi:hypothetical protein
MTILYDTKKIEVHQMMIMKAIMMEATRSGECWEALI